MKRLILLRHAQIEARGYIGSRSDVPLSEEGRSRARELVEQLLQLRFDRILSSHLLRCTQTLAPYREATNDTPKVILEQRLSELDFGLFDGLEYDTIARKYPLEMASWFEDSIDRAPPEGESLRMLHARVGTFLDELTAVKGDQTILICGHGGSLRAVICHSLGLSERHHWAFSLSRGNFAELAIYDREHAMLTRLDSRIIEERV